MARAATRTVVSALFVGVLLVATAAPALAIRDPFQPLITENTDTGSTDTTGSTTTTTTTAPTTTTPAADEPTPTTGWDPSSWLGLATLVLVLGAGLLVFVRFLEPAKVRIRR